MGWSGCFWATELLLFKWQTKPCLCKACVPVCRKPSVPSNPKHVWRPQCPPPAWTSCSVWFGFAHVKLSVYSCAGFILCFYNSKKCASSVLCFTFREKKARSWFGTRATKESTQCQSSQRRRGKSFNFLFDLNMIPIMSPVQGGSFSAPHSETTVLSSRCYHTQETLENFRALMALKFLNMLWILQLLLSHPASDGSSDSFRWMNTSIFVRQFQHVNSLMLKWWIFLVYFSW